MNVTARWPVLDLYKFLLALLLIVAHYTSEYAPLPGLFDTLTTLYIVAVPFYLTCSSFLFFQKKDASIRRYLQKILTMYGAWSIIYFAFVVADWAVHGVTIKKVFSYLHECLVYSTYPTIWFLPALAVGMALTVWCSKRLTEGQLYVLAAGCYLIGAFGGSYAFCLEGTFAQSLLLAYEAVFLTTRNGLFHAFPLAVLGRAIAKNRKDGVRSLKRDGLLSLLFLAGLCAEGLVLKLVFHNADENTILLLVPFTYYELQFLLDLPLGLHWKGEWLRRMSTYLFTCQRIWLSAVPNVWWAFGELLTLRWWIGLPLVLLLTILTAQLLLVWGKCFLPVRRLG